MKIDYYEILGVKRGCDEKTLKSSFRKLAMRYHPDRNPGDVEAEKRFKEIGEAYEILKDPQKRAAYDRYGHAAFEQGEQRTEGFSAGTFGDIFEQFFGEQMGGSTRRRRNTRKRGADLRYDLEITLEEAYFGKKTKIQVPTSITCDSCQGRGTQKGTSPVACKTCRGTGHIRSTQGFFSIERTCPSCGGNGEVVEHPCHACHGRGTIEKVRVLSVSIPAGVDHGTRLRLSGEGNVGYQGGPNGDFYVFLSVKQHELFQRQEDDLYCNVPISMITATLGGQFEISTLDGTKTRVHVPEGTQNGRQFRLKGKGMPTLERKSFGDLYIQVNVETPQKLTKRQRELLQEFDELSNHENSPQSHGFFFRMKEFFESIGT